MNNVSAAATSTLSDLSERVPHGDLAMSVRHVATLLVRCADIHAVTVQLDPSFDTDHAVYVEAGDRTSLPTQYRHAVVQPVDGPDGAVGTITAICDERQRDSVQLCLSVAALKVEALVCEAEVAQLRGRQTDMLERAMHLEDQIRQHSRTGQQNADYEERLRRAEGDRIIAMREVHHRVKNNLQFILSLLALQQSRTADADVARVFEDVSQRIFTMAVAHEQLYRDQAVTAIDLGALLAEMIDHAAAIIVSPHVRLEFEQRPRGPFVPMSTAIPIALIVNELITNSIRHAFPGDRTGIIRVGASFDRTVRTLTIWTEDDGAGITATNEDGMGSLIIESLRSQIGAEVIVGPRDVHDCAGCSGTRAELRLTYDETPYT